MDDECRGVRQRKKQADPTCCPVCGITVRAHEMEQHYLKEMELLNKLSVQKCRKSQTKEMPLATAPTATTNPPSPSPSSATSTASDSKECWTTYQRIKNNRSARLKVSDTFACDFDSIVLTTKSILNLTDFFFFFTVKKSEAPSR